MNKKIRGITKTGMLLALLICLQWIGSWIPQQMVKQLVTGTCVNCVLAIGVLYAGWSSGIIVALLSPVFAFLLTIAPNIITVLPIMVGNVCYVAVLRGITGKTGKPVWRQFLALPAASLVKFGILYVLVVKIVCGVAADGLLGKKLGNWVLLAPKMMQVLPGMFAWPQLITALSGGAIALLILPALKKSSQKSNS